MSWATDALDKVRTAAWREAKKKGTARKGARDPIKGARWALLKNESDLTAGQKAQLECVANTNVCFVKLGWAVSACFLVRLSGWF